MALSSAQKNTADTTGSYASSDSSSRSYLGKTMVINGKITSDDYLTIEGKVTGDIHIGKTVTIGKSGQVVGEIKAEDVRIEGKVEGSVTAKNRLQVSALGNFRGTVKTEKLVVEEGAVFKGKINVDE